MLQEYQAVPKVKNDSLEDTTNIAAKCEQYRIKKQIGMTGIRAGKNYHETFLGVNATRE
jgi:hypothetical protein